MKKLFLSISMVSLLIFSSCGGEQKNTDDKNEKTENICFYAFDPVATTTVKWRAFKTEAKVGVGGQFDQVNITAGDKSTKIKDVLQTIKFSIPTSSTNTSNEDRDGKIMKSFFGTMEATDLIIGQVKSVEGDNSSGKCTFFLTMNNVEQETTLGYTVEDKAITLTGEIDVNNWNGQAALGALNEVCSDLHKGEGTKSVLWPTVELTIATLLKKDCH